MWENCKAYVEMDDSASCLRLAAMESCKLRRIRPQICVGNPVRKGWFEVTHESTRSPGSGPSQSQENRLKSVPFGSVPAISHFRFPCLPRLARKGAWQGRFDSNIRELVTTSWRVATGGRRFCPRSAHAMQPGRSSSRAPLHRAAMPHLHSRTTRTGRFSSRDWGRFAGVAGGRFMRGC